MARMPAGKAAKYFWEARGRYFAGDHMGTVAYAVMLHDIWAGSVEDACIAYFDAYVECCWIFSIFGWAYMKTKNVWPCILFHGVNNVAVNWMSGSDTVENISVYDYFDYITMFIAVIIMLFFLFAKEYRKEGRG